MNPFSSLTLAIAAATATGAAFAADGVSVQQVPAASRQQRLETAAAAQVRQAQAKTAGLKAMGTSLTPGTPQANPYRAYPPSCAADPLPDASGSNGVILSQDLPLYTKDANGRTTPETVKVTLWRIACSSGNSKTPYNATGQGSNSMTLLRFDRSAANEGATDRIPTMPLVQIQQAGIGYDDAASLVRVAAEPNTVISEAPFDSPIIYSTTYVLENFPFGEDYNHQFNQAFKLLVDPQDTDVANYPTAEFDVPAYAPTQGTYPDANGPLFLDGYAAAQWINLDTDDGLLVQIAEQYDGGGAMTRQLVFDLLVRDLDGNPFWLVGNAVFPLGAKEIEVGAYYLGNGGDKPAWGKATFRLHNCNRLDVTFAPNAGLVAPVPSFQGTRPYTRLFSANGMLCE